jgi:hypothetical protein
MFVILLTLFCIQLGVSAGKQCLVKVNFVRMANWAKSEMKKMKSNQVQSSYLFSTVTVPKI